MESQALNVEPTSTAASEDSGAHPRATASVDDGGLTGADGSFGFGPADSERLSGELPAGADLGGVTILRLLAAGGMGRVYEARQEAPRRTVAVKVLREGVVSASTNARLLREAEMLARLKHQHIAQIHTCGTAPPAYGGVPFFVMELVANARPITRYAALKALSTRARVALFRKVCDAVAHGHRHGVIHRDLKPANILVDGHGDPKVIDYGIARGQEATPEHGASAAGGPVASTTDDVVGTLRYMSPEQVLAPERGPDARSDVYALGLVLHELLTGRLPYDLAGKSVGEAARILGSRAAPGTALVERVVLGEERRDDARSLAVIVAKCLEPAADDRYAHAGDVAAELGRWLDGRAIEARPPTPLESLRRMTRRHRLAVAAAAGMAATLLVAVVSVSLLSWRLAGQRRAAQAAQERAATEAAAAQRQLYASTVLLAAAARDRDNLGEARHLLAEAGTLAATAADGRPVELACLAASLDEALVVVPESESTVTAVAWSPDGRVLATGDRGGVVRLRDGAGLPAGPPRVLATAGSAIWSVAFAPDGRILAVAAGDGGVALYDVVSGRKLSTLDGHREAVYAVAFSPDGSRLATASRDKTARTWNVDTCRQMLAISGHEGTVYGVAFSPDGSALVTGSHDGRVRMWDADTGRLRRTFDGHGDRVFDVAIGPDGRSLASASEDGTVRLWDVDAGVETGCLRHPRRVNALAVSARGDRIATAAADGVIRIWDAVRGVELAHLRGHAVAAWSIAWGPGDERLVSGDADGMVRLWSTACPPDVIPAGVRVLCTALSPDGTTLAAGVEDAEIRLWDATTLVNVGKLEPAMGRVHGVAWSPDGRLVAGACDDGALFVWDAASRDRLVATQAHAKRIYAVAFADDGGRLATASEDRTVAIRDPRTGGVVGPVLPHPRRVFCAAFAPGGSRLATACEDRMVRIWDLGSDREPTRLAGHAGPVNWVTYSPDGSRIATASSDGTVRLWSAHDGSPGHVLAGPASQVWKVAFSPDGTRVAAAAADGTVHLWDAVSGRPALTLPGHRDQVWGVAFAADGGSLFSGSWDGTVRVWGVSAAGILDRRAAVDPARVPAAP